MWMYKEKFRCLIVKKNANTIGFFSSIGWLPKNQNMQMVTYIQKVKMLVFEKRDMQLPF